jgi:hypothetical protein
MYGMPNPDQWLGDLHGIEPGVWHHLQYELSPMRQQVHHKQQRQLLRSQLLELSR